MFVWYYLNYKERMFVLLEEESKMMREDTRAYRRLIAKRRRERQLRARLMFIAMLFSVICISFFATHTSTHAEDTEPVVKYKYYTTYQIEKGDTLWSIAETYMDKDYYHSVNDYIKEVRQMNHLSSDKIQEGKSLMIAYYSTEYR